MSDVPVQEVPRTGGRRLAAAVTVVVTGSLLAVGGCVQVGPETPPPVELYDLAPLTPPPAQARPLSWSLVVEEPAAAGGLAGDRIAARPEPRQLRHLSGARWSEPAPRMIQRLLVESLQASGRFAAVGRLDAAMAADYRLVTELQAFEVELTGEEPARVRLRLAALLLEEPGRRAVASRTFERRVGAEGGGLGSLIAAFDVAFSEVCGELLDWLVTAADTRASD